MPASTRHLIPSCLPGSQCVSAVFDTWVTLHQDIGRLPQPVNTLTNLDLCVPSGCVDDTAVKSFSSFTFTTLKPSPSKPSRTQTPPPNSTRFQLRSQT
ncbi:hypothetical protein BaRGS_00000580 [Batillaria attramentaria]|uniref:Uncharacterized protein n=1 Tax=Batillaria attramentaria TaxID=370345 RepID=A0ABD0MAE9_9CAEN